jgi:predicted anti-sigma-YlaC factor YlaD
LAQELASTTVHNENASQTMPALLITNALALLSTKTSAGSPDSFRGLGRLMGLLLLASLLGACMPRQLLVNSAADALTAQGQAEEEDIGLAREASAFYLKVSESLLRQTPGHLPLAESVASGFTQYAYAFVAFEAERLAPSDAKAAHQLNERARRLYWRAHRHAMAALNHTTPGFSAALAQPQAALWPKLRAEQVGVAYWAAASWGAYIALSKDDPDAVADLPLAVRLAELAWRTTPDHGQGTLTSLMGSFEAARPGGSMAKAAAFFDQAFAISGNQNPGPLVAKAEAIAQAAGDRPAFEALLQQALTVSAKRNDLASQIMRQRAQWLLDSADDLF